MEINNSVHNIISSNIAPNPMSVKYWADTNEDPTGSTIKCHNGVTWERINKPIDSGISSKIENITTVVTMISKEIDRINSELATINNKLVDMQDEINELKQPVNNFNVEDVNYE